MVRISVLYPNLEGARFDMKYYLDKHMPLVKTRFQKYGLVRVEVDKGLGGAGGAPAPFLCIAQIHFNSLQDFQKGMDLHGQELLRDIPNYTDIQPQIQMSEIVSL